MRKGYVLTFPRYAMEIQDETPGGPPPEIAAPP
jgi:hypothetical protein